VIADGMDSLLQSEFGGKTAFIESMPSSMKHWALDSEIFIA
jgi:hypothetical protein